MTVVLVMAKAPVPGLAKTRLAATSGLSPVAAARLASAALQDTLRAVLQTPDTHPVVAFTGDLARAAEVKRLGALLERTRVIPQRGETFGERLANAHRDASAGLPVLQIGMDTPQVTGEDLSKAIAVLRCADAALGAAEDGGWWALGLQDANHAEVLSEVAMSTEHTGRDTRLALTGRGLSVAQLPTLTDVDTADDAALVAGLAPHSRFATLWRAMFSTESGIRR